VSATVGLGPIGGRAIKEGFLIFGFLFLIGKAAAISVRLRGGGPARCPRPLGGFHPRACFLVVGVAGEGYRLGASGFDYLA